MPEAEVADFSPNDSNAANPVRGVSMPNEYYLGEPRIFMLDGLRPVYGSLQPLTRTDQGVGAKTIYC